LTRGDICSAIITGRRRRRHTAKQKLRIVTSGFGTGRQKMALERWTNPKRPRRTCSPRHGLQSCRRKSAGVAKRPRERSRPRNPVTIRTFCIAHLNSRSERGAALRMLGTYGGPAIAKGTPRCKRGPLRTKNLGSCSVGTRKGGYLDREVVGG
jgi:hypothetical protein